MDIDLIKELYIKENYTQKMLADRFNMSNIKIKNILKKYNIKKNSENKLITTNCENCNKEIKMYSRDYNRNKHHVCSKECRDKITKIYKTCEHCGKELLFNKSREGQNMYFCDEECYKTWKKESSIQICCICGKEAYNVNKFKDKYYCKKHYNHMYRHGRILNYTIHEKNEMIDHEEYFEVILKDVKGNITGTTYIDFEDYDMIKDYKIYRHKNYAVINLGNGQKKNLHNFLMSCEKGKLIDHINQDFHDGILGTLDNRKNNLRIGNSQKNSFNMLKKINKGIRKNKNNFSCIIMINYKNIWIGVYDSFEEAVVARMLAEILIFKEYRNICLDEEKIKIYNKFSKEELKKIENKVFNFLLKKNIEIDMNLYKEYINKNILNN
jgi:hypothetical protein